MPQLYNFISLECESERESARDQSFCQLEQLQRGIIRCLKTILDSDNSSVAARAADYYNNWNSNCAADNSAVYVYIWQLLTLIGRLKIFFFYFYNNGIIAQYIPSVSTQKYMYTHSTAPLVCAYIGHTARWESLIKTDRLCISHLINREILKSIMRSSL